MLRALPTLGPDGGTLQELRAGLTTAMEQDVKCSLLLTAVNYRLSLLETQRAALKAEYRLKVDNALGDPYRDEVRLRPDGSERAADEKRLVAEALYGEDRDRLAEMEGQIRELKMYLESLKATRGTILRFRQDVTKHLQAIDLMRELGEVALPGGRRREERRTRD